MDTSLLVRQAQKLTEVLDKTPVHPRAVMWVRSEDTGIWRLWVVPAEGINDQRIFYRLVAEAISSNWAEVEGFDIGSIEFATADHPGMAGLGRLVNLPGVGGMSFTGNTFNGFYLPEGIVVRMDLRPKAA